MHSMRDCPRRTLSALFLAGLALLTLPAVGQNPPVAGKAAPRAGATPSFERDIRPIVAKYCNDCHGGAKPKADLNLAAMLDESAVLKNRKVWEQAVEFVEDHEMPPKGKPQPSQAEIEQLTGGITALLTKFECGRTNDPGSVTIRRLNRSEYNNTVRDLVGVDFSPADDFPSDDVGYGFDNIGDVLTMPPILMEKYLAAAERIAEMAIVAGPSALGPTKTFEAEDLGKGSAGGKYNEWARVLASNGEIVLNYDFPRNGTYVIRARAFGQQAGAEPARMAFKIDGKVLKSFDVKAVESAPALYEDRAKLHSGQRKLSVAFTNDFYDEKVLDKNKRDRNLIVDYIEIQGPLPAEGSTLPESHRRIIFRKPAKPADRVECALAIIDRFASRAYRRAVTPGEVARLMKFVDLAHENGDSFERGIQLMVEAVLVSPQFLFRVELDQRKKRGDPTGAQPINDFELASRLSYFLWSSMPDEELFQTALNGKLRTEGNLEKQVRRMIKDRRAKALVDDFAEQWLQIRNLRNVSPDKGRFPQFDEPLRTAMMKETELFFESIVREDRSVIELLDANYTFLNERLAKHYGIAGVKGEEFHRVFLKNDQRGGILTQASILTITSNPTRTSPVKRGKWILEQLLGTPPPPPPANVPELKEDKAVALTGTLRQRMEQHRADPNCASCHARMDPLGFGFENYDAVGAWREKEGDFPVDASGTLPSGQSFRGAKELKAVLKTREREFARCLTEKLLTYGIGRGLEYYDRCAVDRIVDALARDKYKFSRLVLEVVQSDPFQKRRGRGN